MQVLIPKIVPHARFEGLQLWAKGSDVIRCKCFGHSGFFMAGHMWAGEVNAHDQTSMSGLAGFPTTVERDGTSRVTIAPMPTIAPLPMVTPCRMTAPEPI